ncbi:MAG: mechanosensitive ion channel family protein [Chloroflexi bacterium]|nr:mechanosensitive ion channel family protein [Chloroflexota bacterium]
MPTFSFEAINASALVSGVVQVVVILAGTVTLVKIMKRAIPKVMIEHLPRIREETQGQLALRSATLSTVITQIGSAVIWTVACLMMLSVLSVDITPVLATVGIPALAIGFAAQNIIRDYFNGFFIILEDWYRVGEVAVVGGIGGLVEDISLRRTVLRDLNGTMHVIPNSRIEFASNMTRDWARINLDVSVAYKEDLERVIDVINDVCQGLRDDPVWGCDLLTTPKVERVESLGDHGIDIKILGDTRPIRQWALTGELRKRLKHRFDQEGIEIPWPHTMVYFGNQPSVGASGMADGLAAAGKAQTMANSVHQAGVQRDLSMSDEGGTR